MRRGPMGPLHRGQIANETSIMKIKCLDVWNNLPLAWDKPTLLIRYKTLLLFL